MADSLHFWSNWSGSQQTETRLVQPRDLNQLAKAVQQYPKIRVVGAGHSFSPVVKTTQTMLSLEHFKGIAEIDAAQCQSTIWSGTRLYDVGEKLAVFNQALINQGDIDQQTLAGAMATGTHGTGINLGCLSSLITGFELMTASGDVLQCDAVHHPTVFQAGRVALGSFGIMTKISLQNRPMYRLKEQIYLCPITTLYRELESWKDQHRHIEFLAFLHSDQVILKTLDETDAVISARSGGWPDDDFLLKLCCELTRCLPQINPYLQKLLRVFVRPSQAVDWSSRIFPTPRHTRFNEMEYQIPVAQGLACFEEILFTLKKHKAPVFFPLEFRYVKADDIWLSPFYERDSVSISVHQFYKQNYQEIFKLIEPIFWKYQGRPHWGKLHSLSAQQLADLYPRWEGFMQIRQQLDPKQKWLNPYLEQLFFF